MKYPVLEVDDRKTVLFYTASRSDRQLSKPLIRRLEKSPLFNVITFSLPTDFEKAFRSVKRQLKDWTLINLVFCPYDRLEMLGAALMLWTHRVPLVQVHAGDFSSQGCFDDVARHMITLCSDIQFCVGKASHDRAMHLLNLVGKPVDRCYLIDSIHMDDVKLSYKQVPYVPFDLVLYNPPTKRLDLLLEEVTSIDHLLEENKPVIWIAPNEDEGRTWILEEVQRISRTKNVKLLKTLPRPQFLGLLKKCDRAIGNSSSFFYELPHFNKKHIHIGVRNTGREYVDSTSGGSAQIVKILEGLYG